MADGGTPLAINAWLDELFFIFFGLAVILLFVVLGFVTYGILAERKLMGFMQGRIGPNHLGGRFGLLQTVADVLKLLLKEDTIPKAADRPLFIFRAGDRLCARVHGAGDNSFYRESSVCRFRSRPFYITLLFQVFRLLAL
ncbi:hypothetical protein GCM10020331_023600 [Ectobacillus funiculus]